ncbi:MAG: radical SAM protein [Candidatus Asgardarchaeia archaeon]
MSELEMRESYESLFEKAGKIYDKNFGKSLKVYFPGKKFPSISITGNFCELNCKHCNRKYLKHMLKAETPEKLINLCKKLEESGAVGCLISGGFTKEGYLRIGPFINSIRWIKENTNLLLNVHTGLIGKDLMEGLYSAGVDAISFDLTGSEDVIRKVYGMRRSVGDYIDCLNGMIDLSLPVVPHIGIGFNFGKVGKHELGAVSILKDLGIEKMVFLVLRPTPGTEMGTLPKVSVEDVKKVIAISRILIPKADISLGCMRPGGEYRRRLDGGVLEIGINRIVMPSKKTMEYIKKRFSFKIFERCCVF